MDVQKVDEIVAEGSLPMAYLLLQQLAFMTLSVAEECIVLNGGMIDESERIQKEAVLA
jgi:hypothetical protein